MMKNSPYLRSLSAQFDPKKKGETVKGKRSGPSKAPSTTPTRKNNASFGSLGK